MSHALLISNISFSGNNNNKFNPGSKTSIDWKFEASSAERWKRIVGKSVVHSSTTLSGMQSLAKDISGASANEISLAVEQLKNEMNSLGLYLIACIREDENEKKAAIKGLGFSNSTNLTDLGWKIKGCASGGTYKNYKFGDVPFTPLCEFPKLIAEVALQEKSSRLACYCSSQHFSKFGLEASKPLIDLLGSNRVWRALENMSSNLSVNKDDASKAAFASHISKFMGDMNVNYDSRETISNLLEFISAYHPDEAIRKTALGNMASRGDCAPDCIPLHIMDVAAESPHADIAIAATDKAYKLLGSRIFNEMWFSCVLNSKIPEVRLHAFDLIKKDYNVGNSCAFLNLCPGEHYPKLPKDIEALMLVHLEGKYASSLQTIWAEAPLIWLAKHSQKHGLDAYLKVHEWMVAKKHIAPTEHLSKFAADEAVRLEASKGAYLIKEANKKKSEEPAS